jgi:hypothetical protein
MMAFVFISLIGVGSEPLVVGTCPDQRPNTCFPDSEPILKTLAGVVRPTHKCQHSQMSTLTNVNTRSSYKSWFPPINPPMPLTYQSSLVSARTRTQTPIHSHAHTHTRVHARTHPYTRTVPGRLLHGMRSRHCLRQLDGE